MKAKKMMEACGSRSAQGSNSLIGSQGKDAFKDRWATKGGHKNT
jgi:hypothetical protein